MDPEMRRLLDDVFESDSDDLLEARFAALRADLDWRRAEHDRREREHRRQGGGPARARLLRDGELDAAVAEWSQSSETPQQSDDSA